LAETISVTVQSNDLPRPTSSSLERMANAQFSASRRAPDQPPKAVKKAQQGIVEPPPSAVNISSQSQSGRNIAEMVNRMLEAFQTSA